MSTPHHDADCPPVHGSPLGSRIEYPRAAASAAVVNRTHRIVRERARKLQARRSKARSLWIPVAVSAGLVVLFVFAVWSLLDQYEASPTGLPDASQQIFVLLMWCLPVSAGLLAAVWVSRDGGANSSGKAGGENAK